jgi:Zn-dependent protease
VAGAAGDVGCGYGVWNPLKLMSQRFLIPHTLTAYYLFFVFAISYGLLLFNLWPIFPLDGGQLVQSLLWVKIGYYRANVLCVCHGIIGAAIMFAFGVAAGPSWLLILVAISGNVHVFEPVLAAESEPSQRLGR